MLLDTIVKLESLLWQKTHIINELKGSYQEAMVRLGEREHELKLLTTEVEPMRRKMKTLESRLRGLNASMTFDSDLRAQNALVSLSTANMQL